MSAAKIEFAAWQAQMHDCHDSRQLISDGLEISRANAKVR